jgi:hypothetical protein
MSCRHSSARQQAFLPIEVLCSATQRSVRTIKHQSPTLSQAWHLLNAFPASYSGVNIGRGRPAASVGGRFTT